MESSGGFSFNDTNQTMRKKRSDRRPRNDIQQGNNNSSLSSPPPSNNGSKGPSDDSGDHDTKYQRKILNLNQCNSRASYTNSELETHASSDDKDTAADTSEVIASTYKDTNYDDGHNPGSLDADPDAKEVDNVVKKVKLKVGGVTRTIHTKSSSLKPPHHSKQKQNSQESPDPQDVSSGLRGIPWKDFSRSGFSVGKTASSRHTTAEKSISKNHNSVNNSKRVAKKRVLDDNDDDDEDAELRYLAKMKLKSTKVNEDEEGGSKKHRRISSVMESFGSEKERKKLKTVRDSEDNDFSGEDRVSGDAFGEESSREMTVTTRRKALQSGRDVSGDLAASVVEFPHGLPPAPPRKQKEKLTEVEHQLKKAEAAQRRKIQAAKAAKESEAEAIRKILGQESSRKKRETKMKQRQEELAQERNSNAATLSSNTVRLMIRPTGTVVTFLMILACQIYLIRGLAVTLPHERNVRVPLVQIHSSTEIQSPNSPCAASNATRQSNNTLGLFIDDVIV